MASNDPAFIIQEEAKCSICKGFYQDPVTIECGHNFCLTCLTKYLGEGNLEIFCPECAQPFDYNNLIKNKKLKKIAETAQLLKAPENPLDGSLCEEHGEKLQLFCEADHRVICLVCRESGQHEEHHVRPIKEAWTAYKDKLQSLLSSSREKTAYMSEEISKEKEDFEDLTKQFKNKEQKIYTEFENDLQTLIEKQEARLKRLHDEEVEIKVAKKQKTAKLTSGIMSLNIKTTEMERMFNMSDVDFLQNVSSTLNRCGFEKFLGPKDSITFQKSEVAMTSCQAQRKIYKKHICKIFTRTAENAQWSVERVKVRERHAKLLIWKEYSWKEEKSHELLSRKKKSLELINLEALFDLDEDGYVPQTVVLQGVSGIGKTTTAQKMLVGWASGELFQDMFEYVFYIHCRELKPLTGQEAVEDLILRSCGGERCISMSDVEAEPDKVLFIIDGFDALKIPTHVLSPDPAKPSLVDKTLVSLVRKDYLSGCSLIVTTRPAALETLLRWLQRAHWAEVPEFSEDEREEYFNTFFGNEQRGALGFKIVKENEVLFSMCSLPSVCWIVCVVIEQQMEDERCLQNALKTLTSVYLTFVSGVVRPPSCAGDQVLMNNTLKRLCALAAEGVHQQNTEFEEVDLTRHGLQAPALRALFLKDDIFTGSQGPCSLYSFRHLSLQEFFAALFYVLEAAEDAEMFDHKVTSLLGDFKEQKNHHLLRTVRFLFGLLRKEILFQMRTGLQWKNSPEVKPALLQWVRTETKDMSDNIGDQELALFHCMYEMQYDELRKSLLEKHKDFKFSASSFTRELGTADFRVLAFCFKDALGEIGFEKIKMKPEQLGVLRPALMKCYSLMLSNCCLTSAHHAELTLLFGNRSLNWLNLTFNELKDSGLRAVCKLIKDPEYELESLGIEYCQLTAACCEDLTSVLTRNNSLVRLFLSGNHLRDSGVRKLCEGLKHRCCKIQDLDLDDCSLSGSCCADLASALQTNSSLRDLNLSENELGDSGVQELCDGLKHVNCKIENLNLKKTGLTDVSAEVLCSTLRATTSIQELDLSCNNFSTDAALSFRELKIKVLL